MIKGKVLILSYFDPPKAFFSIDGLEIKSARYRDILKNYEESQLSMFGGEWFALSKKRQPELDKFEDSIWTFLVKDKNQFNDSCYLSVLDLFTENWKYIFERNEKLRLSSFATPNWNPPTYEFTKIIKLRFRKSLKLINTSVRFRIALERWFSSYTRNTSYLDSLLDCCSALEAILGVRDEIRLRISLSTFYILSRKINKSQAKKSS